MFYFSIYNFLCFFGAPPEKILLFCSFHLIKIRVKVKTKIFIVYLQYNKWVTREWNYYPSDSLGTNNDVSLMMTTQTILQ